MLTDSLAPIKRAALFFGFMGVAVAALTLGADLQGSADQSSATVAQAKIERNLPTDAQFAAVDARQRAVSTTQRAIPTSQQASLDYARTTVSR